MDDGNVGKLIRLIGMPDKTYEVVAADFFNCQYVLRAEEGYAFISFKEFSSLWEFVPMQATAMRSLLDYKGSWPKESIVSMLRPIGCVHKFKAYVGFTELYEYCTKCDEKKYG